MEEAERLAREIDEKFGWLDKQVTDHDMKVRRATTQPSYLFTHQNAIKNDAKSDMLHVKIIASLCPEYRSPTAQLFRLRKGGFHETVNIHLA